MKTFVYADNSATTQLDEEVFEAMKPYLMVDYSNASEPYTFSKNSKLALKNARQAIADCVGADYDEIFFTSGGTESDNWAIKSIALSSKEPKRIVTSAFEHHAILHSCESIKCLGHKVDFLQPSTDGFILKEVLAAALTQNADLVSIMMINNEIGTVQDIKELAAIAHGKGALFHTDAVQAVGHLPINVHELNVDMLSSSAHKFNGPKGVGFLYIKKGTELGPYIDGGAQEMRKRAGTENIASIVGMATALEINCREMEENQKRIRSLENKLIEGLVQAKIPFHRNGMGNTAAGIINLSFNNIEGEALLHRLDLMGIEVSTGSACNGSSTEISHVLKAIKLNEELAKGTIRISLGKYNTEEDVNAILVALTKILR